ncbi:MAG: 16S rRNA (guanine(527)-N(7))-methyltransferase RsmG [Bacteroidetes bacterium]|nr:16S rRNA (guanine(527)-N(7))-methyltransferase RsmG [Bacteroidota bacterium]
MERLKEFLEKELKISDFSVYEKFLQYNALLMEWNAKINLVSRKQESIENNIINSVFFLTKFNPGGNFSLVDIGTGGGFPGIPLKIIFPKAKILCVDSISKKIMVVNDVIAKMELENITAIAGRGEEIGRKKEYQGRFDFVTAKAVAPVKEVMKFGKDFMNNNGRYILIKGGDISEEIKGLKQKVNVIDYNELEGYGVEDKKLVVI